MTDLDQLLADTRSETHVLRKAGQTHLADYVADLCDRIADATEDYRVFLSEPEAMLRSAKSKAWLRSRFPEWLAEGNARLNARKEREYRLMLIPRRANVSAAREAGARAAERAS